MPWDSKDTTGGLHLRDRSLQSTTLCPCLCSWELPSAAWHQAWHAQRLSQHGAGLAPLLRPLRPRRARPWVPGPAPAPRQGRGDTGRTGGRISVSSAWDLRVNLPPFILQSVNTQHPGDVAEYFWITEGCRGLQAGAGGTAMLGPPSPAQPRPLQGCLPSGVTGLEAARRLQPSPSGPVCVVLIVLIWKPVDKHTSSKNPVFSLKLWKPT